MLVVLLVNRQPSDLAEALDGDVAELRVRRELEQRIEQRGLEDVPERDPGQKRVQRLQRQLDQRRLLRVREYELDELVNLRKVRVERVLELHDLRLRQLPAAEVEHLLAQQLQDVHAVLAQRLGLFRGADEIWDERRPPRGPVVLEYLHQDAVDLGDEGALPAERRVVGGELDDEVGDEVLDALPLIVGEGVPSVLDHRVENLQGEELGVWVLALFQDGIRACPHHLVLLQPRHDLLRLGAHGRVAARGVEGVHDLIEERDIEGLVVVEELLGSNERHGDRRTAPTRSGGVRRSLGEVSNDGRRGSPAVDRWVLSRRG
mmetsp:Transcript_12333/g.57073  ORF Transcript_12333/g.57073 Transcript_12333/m.57073 type:complete len:318 (+) Transcript_12333:2501-3454(+)